MAREDRAGDDEWGCGAVRRLIVTAVVFGAVGSVVLGVGGVAGAKTQDPCQLLKEAQITKVMKQPSGPPDLGQPTPYFEQCYWDLEANDKLAAGSVGTVVQTELAKQTFDSNKAASSVKNVKGLKDAYINEDVQTISVLRGDTMLSVQVLSFDPDTEIAETPRTKEMVKLTKLALKQLQT